MALQCAEVFAPQPIRAFAKVAVVDVASFAREKGGREGQ